ncbi:helix-turn-helix domain-containing protein [Sphingomonas sp. ERG5]|uniref:sigma factor-like helix-turn-helix DNA-binding protein n=1 Tax=Sphingomonas sp. ERG5 TaxID=1381597 RepID=UPI0009DEB226
MPPGGIDQLTEAQRACLRLVLTRRNSKEIAQVLNISPHSVDKRIERAVAALGAASRFDAARRLADHEGGQTYEPIAHEPIDVASPAVQAPPRHSTAPSGYGRRLFGFAPVGRINGDARNDLTKLQRAGIILALMVGIAVATGALLNIAATLTDKLRENRIDLSR